MFGFGFFYVQKESGVQISVLPIQRPKPLMPIETRPTFSLLLNQPSPRSLLSMAVGNPVTGWCRRRSLGRGYLSGSRAIGQGVTVLN